MSKNTPNRKRKSAEEDSQINSKKVKALLKEYDLEVESRKDQMRRYAASLEVPIKNVYWSQLSRLTSNIKKMPISEFCEKYKGDVNLFIQNIVDEKISQIDPKLRKVATTESKTNENVESDPSKFLSQMLVSAEQLNKIFSGSSDGEVKHEDALKQLALVQETLAKLTSKIK